VKILKQYFFKILSQTFFPIFFTLFAITSIIFLVKIASLTSIIQINFLELLELYSFSLPTILFYTIPISTFISVALTLAKLSSEYELIVITSFGLNPLKIVQLVLPFLLLVSIVVLMISLVFMPKAEYLRNSFLVKKKNEAQFNIKPSEYGQVFGKWLLYVNAQVGDRYKDIVLFTKEKDEDTFIISREAKLNNKDYALTLKLDDGKAIRITDTINQIDFEKMTINNNLKQSKNINNFNDLIGYWGDMFKNSSKLGDFIFHFLGSLLPLLSVVFMVSIGYYNPRYNKNRTTSVAIFLTFIYVLIIHRLSEPLGLNLLYFMPIGWVLLSLLYFRLRVKSYY